MRFAQHSLRHGAIPGKGSPAIASDQHRGLDRRRRCGVLRGLALSSGVRTLEVRRASCAGLRAGSPLASLRPVGGPAGVGLAIAYAWTFWLTINGGVADGGTFIYFTAGAFGILLIGAERVFLCVLIGAVAVGLLIFSAHRRVAARHS